MVDPGPAPDPSPEERARATGLLHRICGGEDASAVELFPVVYDQLRGIAELLLRRERVGHTLQATALVNEAYLKLFAGGEADYQNRQHFFATAARAMRQVVIDYARARLADCRGAGAEHIALDDLDASALPVAAQAERLVAIDAALGRLAALDPRLATVIEMRFFVGMEVEDLAELLQVSVPTIVRDTRTAKAFLQRELDLG